jgi:polysaccharide deacetylase family protein (PEP-CTERM system associated)
MLLQENPQFVRRSPEGATLPLVNALTVDVEDYFHVAAFEGIIRRAAWSSLSSRIEIGTRKLLELLHRESAQATFFVLGWLAERQPGLIREIADAGHEIGCHSYWHRLVYEQAPEEFRDDLRRTRGILEDITGQQVTAYRAPCFSITPENPWALDVLVEEGFTVDSSIYPTYHHRYGFPGAPTGPHQITRPGGKLWELPLPVVWTFGYPAPVGGGGYFRLYPYWLTRHGLHAINAEGRPFVAYIHPWELDPDQPRIRARWRTRLRHYVGLRRTEGRLAQLLHEFRVGTVSDVIRWAEARQPQERPTLRLAA